MAATCGDRIFLKNNGFIALMCSTFTENEKKPKKRTNGYNVPKMRLPFPL